MPRALPLSIAVVLAASAHAVELPGDDDHAVPCRPTIACTADLAAPGTLEIELGYLLRRLAPATSQRTTPLLIKLTVTRWLQLQVATSGAVMTDDRAKSAYLDNINLGAKAHLRDQSLRAPSLSFSVAASVPSGAGPAGAAATWGALFTLYVSKDVGWLHADFNAGVILSRLEGAPLAQGFITLALSTSLPRGFGLMLEGYAFGDASPSAGADAGLLAAICFQPRPWIVIDAGGDLGILPASRAGSLFAGVTIIPAVLWRKARLVATTTITPQHMSD